MKLTKYQEKELKDMLTRYLNNRRTKNIIHVDNDFRNLEYKFYQKAISIFMKYKILVPRSQDKRMSRKELVIQIALGSIDNYILDLNPIVVKKLDRKFECLTQDVIKDILK